MNNFFTLIFNALNNARSVDQSPRLGRKLLGFAFVFWVLTPLQTRAQLSINCVPGFPISCASDIIVDVNAPFVFSNCPSGGTNVSVTGPIIDGENGCPGTTYTYTYTATDNCHPSTSCTQTFTIVNNSGPFITSCPPAKTVNCAYNVIPEPHLVTAESSCGIGSEVSVSGPAVIGPANCPFTQYVYTYTATDNCGRSVSCQQFFSIVNEGPELVCAPEICIVDCSMPLTQIQATFDAFAEQATVINSCNGLDITISNDFNPAALGGCESQQVVNFWATDNCGRSSNCTALVVVVDNTPPSIIGEPYLTIRECDDLVQLEYDNWIADNLANLSATDECGTVSWTHSPASPNEVCAPNGYAITHVEFTATDECGNSSTKAVHFKLKNKFPPTWSNDLPDLSVACDAALPDFTIPTYVHTCGETNLSFVDTTILGTCPGNFELQRIWTVTDGCGQSNVITQSIHVIDTIAPVPPTAPDDLSIDCDTALPPAISLTAIDDCAGPITVLPEELLLSGDCPNQSVVVRTWTFADECGNSSSVSQTININDPEAPVTPTIPNELFFSCANEVPPPLPLTATDNCEGPITALPEIEVIPQNCPNKYTEIRTWNFVDACGNASSLSQTIVVNDLIPPSAMNIPADTIINCADPLEFGPGPNWIDNCGGMIGLMSFEDDTIAGTCPNEWMVTRTWSVVDDCGILGTASQTITIVDPNPPVFSFVPDTIVADCGQMPEFESPIADDACGAVTLTFEESSSQGAVCQGGGYQKRLWTATDECGNTAQVETVLIFLPDTIAPSFVFVPSTPDVDCDEIPEFETPIATDNCGEVELTFEEYQSPGTICDTGFSKKRLWTATDECGNTAQVETAIWVNPDIEAPQFIYIPPTPDVDCDEVPDFEIPEVIDNCGEVELTFEEYQSPGTLCDDGYALKRLWTATDECGNTAQVETAIWVYPDVAAPVFHFIPADSVIACDAFPPVFGEPLVSDACGSFELTFTTQFISGDSSSCANGQMAQYQRIWTAKDNCGQSSTAQQTFTLTAQGNIMGILSGTLRNEQAETIEGAEVRVEGTAGMPLLAQTTSEGSYAFDLPLQHNYQVLPQYDAHPLNGVSTLDLILISKHLLGIEWLDSPYKMIAADVNRSGSLTAYDLVELRKAILYITDGFANNTSWRFIEESFVFVNPMNPFSTTFPEAAAINGLTESEVVNFVGVKIGDVDNSATANSLLGGQTRSEENPFYFAVNDQYLETGKTYEITLAAHAFAQLLGYQFTLEYDREKIRLFDIQTADSPDRGTVHFGLNQLEKGQLTGTWYTTSAKELTKGNQLFTLQFTALQNGQLSEALQLNSKATTAEVYRENGQTSPLNLYFNPSKSAENPLHFALLQNYPNPFKESTQIRFTLPQASTATLQIYDLSGQLLWEKTDEFAQGHNEVPVDQSDLIGNGVFYYRLETPTRNAMKRMIVLYD